jgi:hypothetical protein
VLRSPIVLWRACLDQFLEVGPSEAHSRGVVSRVRELGERCRLDDATLDLLEVSALGHDVAKAEVLERVGFHPLDGARFFERAGEPEVAALVACHSGSVFEARARGREDWVREIESFYCDPLALAILTLADLTSHPDGRAITVHARLREIKERYADPTVSETLQSWEPTRHEMITLVEEHGGHEDLLH